MKTALLIVLQIIQCIIAIVCSFFNALIDAFAKQKGFNAEFGSIRSIASWLKKGFVIAAFGRRLSMRLSMQNVLISGPTGSGKSSRIILPTLFSLTRCSALITDPSKELYFRSSGYLSQRCKIRTINFADASMSSGYNPLAHIKKSNDVNKIAAILVSTTLEKGGNNSDQFWNLQAKSCLSIFLRLALHQPQEYRNLANVLQLISIASAKPERIDELVAKTANEKLIFDWQAFISTPEKTLQLILASAKSALQPFEDEEIAKTTSHNSIDFDELRKSQTVIFLLSSVSEQKYVNVLNSLFYQQFYAHVLDRIPEKHELPIMVILEECSSMYIELLPLALANCRKHSVANMLCVQSSHTQLKATYGDQAKNIIQNCVTKLFLPGETSMEVLREIEALSGKCTYKDEHGTERTKYLVTADEARMLPDNRSLIISGNKPIIKGRTSPYWRNLLFRQCATLPPVPFKTDIPDTPVPLIK